MRNLNFLRKSEGMNVGTTLALTVGSPSAHRRYSALKHLTFMLLFLLGSLNVWGASVSGTYTKVTSVSTLSAGDVVIIVNNAESKALQSISTTSTKYGTLADVSATNNVITLSNANVEEFTLENGNASGQWSFKGTSNISNNYLTWTSGNSLNKTSTKNANSSWTITFNNGTATIANANTTDRLIRFNSDRFACYTTSTGTLAQIYKKGSSSDPTVTADPEEVTDVVAAGVTNQTIGLTYDNISDYETEVSVHPNADGTGTLSPAWLSASVSDANDYATVTYSVAANEGAARTAYIKVYTTDGDKEAETIIPVSQVKYVAPTGTFKLFSGDLVEGDYIFVYATRNNAMKASQSANANRLDYAVVAPSENKIVNPDASLVWHVAPISETAYWTIYSADAEKHIGSTNSNNQAKLLSGDLTDNMKWTVTSNAGKFDFSNVARVAASGNPYLRNNDDGTNHYGFACYANGTGGALTLYKKDDGKPSAPTFSPAGGSFLEAQNVTLSAEDGTEIHYTLDGSAPTSTSALYSAAIPVSSTTTIKAIAIKDEISSPIASATFTITTPLTIAQAVALVPNVNDAEDDQYVEGYVCTAGTSVNSGQMTYYISADGKDDGVVEHKLQIFKGKNLNNTDFSDVNDLAVGDKVVVFGQLKHYNASTYEMNSGNYIVRYTAKGAITSVAVSGTPSKTAYTAADNTFAPAGLIVTATYASGYSAVVTEGITWGDDLTNHEVTASGTVNVTATVSGVTSPAYPVSVEYSAKTLLSIALSYDAVEVYQGLELPKPTVTATYSEGDPADVTAQAEFTGYDASTTGDQEITVSYTFGGETKNANYTVTVNPIYNVELAADVARNLIINVVGNATSAPNEMIVRGIVSQVYNVSSNKQSYWISVDGENNMVEAYNGLYLDGADFTNENKLRKGDEVVTKGHVIYYNNTTPEFVNGESQLQSLARTPNFSIADVASLEVGTTDLALADLTINAEGEGAITLVSGDEAKVTIVDNKIHAVAAGNVTITANLAANGIYKAATTTFNVTVIPTAVKYAISFDGNGADGGDAPEAITDKAAGVEVTLPANNWTKTGFSFTGWKVFNNMTTEEVEVTAGAFEMPASAVTIQAQWAEIPVWAYTYTSNITVGTDVVKFSDELEAPEYAAKKTGTGSAYGSTTVTVPVSTSKLHFHAVCYGADTYAVTLKVKKGDNVLGTFNINKDTGAKGSSPFTLANTPYEQYYSVTLADITEPTTITFEAESGSENGKRFIIFGVNQEGGVLPELNRIEISGDLENKTYEVGDDLDMTGLTVTAYYTLAGNPHHNEVVTDDVEWSYDALVGDQTSVEVTATYEGKSATKEVSGLSVTVPEPEIIASAASLAFNNVAKGAAVADKELTVTLKSVENATLTITGDGASVFSVTPAALTASGTVAVSASSANVGTFNATLTISDDAGAAEAKTVALSITVEASDDLSGTWNLVTDVADLMAGMQVIMASVADGEGNLYTLGGPNGNSANNRLAVASTASGDVLNPEVGTKVITLVDAGNGKYALQLLNGKYLYAQGGTSNNYLKERIDINDQATWTITFEEGKAIIKADVSGRNWIRYNKDNNPKIFSCYASGQQDIVLYAKPFDYTREIAQGVLSTTCLPNGGQIFGASIFEIAYMDYEADGTTPHKIYFDEVEGGIMEAGMPYVILANEGSSRLGVYYTDSENKTAQSKKGLVGYIGAGKYLEENDYFIYNNMFYYVSATDAANNRIHVSNNRAFINLSQVPGYNNEPVYVPAPGRRRVSLGNGANAPTVATGIENTEANEAPRKVLINGELFIIRGEKMYDAKGQLVK